ncbi:Cyclin-K [Microtus ochrogaster]|uniref:Cyclin-K n=1 Tax=Microtus ochrogaster TaxID=79684 RepID=A0A8J6G2D0_MICOH|nr:Cyclin-K [Microtus ochrogaster]
MDHTKPCWYWDKKDLARTPSQLEGLDAATEAQYRREGACFIFDVGIRLGLPYGTKATGITYFHRFYMFHSFKRFPRHVTGAACLFLAGKVEETPKKCNDIIKTAHSLLNDVQRGEFGDEPVKQVLLLEKILLQTIQFDLEVKHPYQYLLRYAKHLKGNKEKIQKLVQMAWTFVNDSLCTTLSLQWEPEIIAVAVMYLAEHLRKFKIQEMTSKPMYKRWWEQFVEDLSVDILEDIGHQILDLYTQTKQQRPHHAHAAQLQQPQSLHPAQLQEPQSLHPAQLQQPQSLHPAQVPQSHPSQGSEAAQPEQGQQQHQEQAQQPKTLPPQPSPPRQAKHTMVDYPEEENQATAPPPKIPRLETTPLPLPPEWKPPIALTSSEADASGPVEASDLPEVQIPPPANQAPVHQPPSLGPPPPLPYSYVTGISSSSSYMPGEGYQNLQSMTMTNGSSYGARHPAYGPPVHLHYQPHVYSPNPPPPPVFPSPASSLLPNISLRIPRYHPLLPHINPNFPPPPPPSWQPPIHVVPPHPLQALLINQWLQRVGALRNKASSAEKTVHPPESEQLVHVTLEEVDIIKMQLLE